jgi:hypothetical protein
MDAERLMVFAAIAVAAGAGEAAMDELRRSLASAVSSGERVNGLQLEPRWSVSAGVRA